MGILSLFHQQITADAALSKKIKGEKIRGGLVVCEISKTIKQKKIRTRLVDEFELIRLLI